LINKAIEENVMSTSEADAIFGNFASFPEVHQTLLQRIQAIAASCLASPATMRATGSDTFANANVRRSESRNATQPYMPTVGEAFMECMKRFKTYAIVMSSNHALLQPMVPRRPLDDFLVVCNTVKHCDLLLLLLLHLSVEDKANVGVFVLVYVCALSNNSIGKTTIHDSETSI
jgi:hypothetical protein